MMNSMGQTRLVLASASPRRRELLKSLGLDFDIEAADIDESVLGGEPARDYVLRVAAEKAGVVAGRRADAWVLGADTSVVIDGQVLGKPSDPADAKRMLHRLSGAWHSVWTGIAVAGVASDREAVETRVHFRSVTPGEIDWYVRTGEPADKAGGYAIQGMGGVFIDEIEGSASNVVGLPLSQTALMLQRAGFPMPWDHS